MTTRPASISGVLDALRKPAVIRSAQVLLPVSIGFLAGIAGCIHAWVVPMLRLGGTTRGKIRQFDLVIRRGLTLLKPGTQVLGASLLGLVLLLRGHPDGAVARQWRVYGLVTALLVSVDPFERALIFPTNDDILDMGPEMDREGRVQDEAREERLARLLDSWQFWHTGRVLIPALAAVVTTAVLVT